MKVATIALALAAAMCGPGVQAATKCHLGKMAELPVRMVDSTPLVTAKVNGMEATFIADTGAFFSLLVPQSAKKFNLKVGPAPFGMELEGLTGKTEADLARANEFTLLGLTLHNVDFLVGGHNLDGVDGLLGQNMLGFTDMEYDLGDGAIRFFEAIDCKNVDLAYWSAGKPYGAVEIDPIRTGADAIRTQVSVNGVKIHVQLDTGAPRSILKLTTARRIGFTPSDPAVTPGGATGGVGGRFIQTWIAPFKSFAIDNEQVENTKLRVGDFNSEGIDMLLGADFFLSHRIYVAKSQSRLYFTYKGGPVFDLVSTNGGPTQGPDPVSATPPSEADPTDAAGFSRRGEAFMSRNQYDRAIADFSRATALEPKEPSHLLDRAVANWRKGALPAAKGDYDAALKLKPGDADILIKRGELDLQSHDDVGARAEFDAALAADPTRHFGVALAYGDYDEFEAEVAELDKAIAAALPGDELATMLNNRCWARALWGRQLDQALADCDAALKLKPNFAPFMDSRGLVELRQGAPDKAIADYNAVLHQTPQNVWSLYGRGLAEQKLGLKAKATADMAAATAIAPNLPARLKALGIAP